MIITTTETIAGYDVIEIKGFVEGSTVQTRHVGRDVGASLKTLIGGEIKGYSDLLNEARAIAKERMVEKAKSLGANAIIGVRLQTSQVMNTASEIIIYGTAVIIE